MEKVQQLRQPLLWLADHHVVAKRRRRRLHADFPALILQRRRLLQRAHLHLHLDRVAQPCPYELKDLRIQVSEDGSEEGSVGSFSILPAPPSLFRTVSSHPAPSHPEGMAAS